MTALDDLEAKIKGTDTWPPKWDTAWATVAKWQAFRAADTDALKVIAHWSSTDSRTYFADPMPAKISGTFADLIFGEDPEFTAANDRDQDRLTEIVEENGLASELQLAADTSVAEGEVWWRILVDPDQADVPLIRWHSRGQVLPLIRGRKVLACAFVSTIAVESDGARVTRLFEVHGDGAMLNLLFEGTSTSLGVPTALQSRPETADLPDVWNHGLPMLAGRVVNKIGRRGSLGVSDYAGVSDYLLALNETATIGQENARLTLKKRVVVPQRFLDKNGDFPAGADVIIATDTDADPDKPGQGLAQIEWSFDAQAFIAYKHELEQTIVARVGLVPQLLGIGSAQDGGGQAITGPAIKLRYMPATLSAAGKARFWDDELPGILCAAQRVDALSPKQDGLGRPWAEPSTPPTVERSATLPEDETEEATRHQILVASELEARQTAIEALHPDWDEARVTEEVDRIKADLGEVPAPDQPASVDSHLPAAT